MTLNELPICVTSLYSAQECYSNFDTREISRDEIRSRNKDAAFKSSFKKVTLRPDVCLGLGICDSADIGGSRRGSVSEPIPVQRDGNPNFGVLIYVKFYPLSLFESVICGIRLLSNDNGFITFG